MYTCKSYSSPRTRRCDINSCQLQLSDSWSRALLPPRSRTRLWDRLREAIPCRIRKDLWRLHFYDKPDMSMRPLPPFYDVSLFSAGSSGTGGSRKMRVDSEFLLYKDFSGQLSLDRIWWANHARNSNPARVRNILSYAIKLSSSRH